jgi:hypothetical protein
VFGVEQDKRGRHDPADAPPLRLMLRSALKVALRREFPRPPMARRPLWALLNCCRIAVSRRLAVDNRAHNLMLRSMRRLGERGFAVLTGRWRTLRHTTASPRRVGDIVRAALNLTHFEYRYLPDCC